MAAPFPLTQCQPMSTEDFDLIVNTEHWWMEPKIDGWRMQLDATRDGVTAWTRTGKSATGKMPWMEKELTKLVGPHSVRFDAEAVLLLENGEPDYNGTARMLGSGTETCVMKQEERGPLTVFVFDILELDGHDVRHRPLEYRKALMWKFFYQGAPLVQIVQGDEPSFEQHTANFQRFKEGSVLKNIHSPYAGKRHKSWLKWKEIETLDVKIIGYKPGQGKFQGLVGAVRFTAPDGTVGYCSGMTDDERVWITDRQDALMGHVIEIKHFGKLVDGFRHPQFVRLREDKS